jgi:RNA polymerase sigma-70 factor (ECF subfamily)
MNSSERESLRAFYVEFRQQLYTYAVSITGSRESAEDAIHGVFQGLLRRGRLPSDLRPYLFRCVRNAALDALRRAGVRAGSIFEDSPAAAAEVPALPAAVLGSEIEQGLRRLSPDERETIILKIYDDLTFQEISELRQTPLPTVASWYRRGLDKLRALLNPETR